MKTMDAVRGGPVSAWPRRRPWLFAVYVRQEPVFRISHKPADLSEGRALFLFVITLHAPFAQFRERHLQHFCYLLLGIHAQTHSLAVIRIAEGHGLRSKSVRGL